MSLTLILILLIPIGISLFCKYALKWDISWKEFGIQLAVGTIVLGLVWGIGRYSAAWDTEVLNGYVTGKHVHYFTCPTNTMNPCQNGYTCHSHDVCSGSGKNRTCHEEHDTCYTYPWEQDWFVDSTLGHYEIHRVDAQGADMPPRYSVAQPNDPVSTTHGYYNWVKGSSDTLYAQDKDAAEQYASLIPTYQQHVYDYYKLDHFYMTNLHLNAQTWNAAIGRLDALYGKKKQINVDVVFVEGPSENFAHALRRKWNGFKKNEAILVVGTNGGIVTWAESMSWSKASIYDIDMRNMVLDHYNGKMANAIDPNEFASYMSPIVDTDYQRRPMKEFEYLKGEIPPPAWLIWLATILAFVLGIGTSILFDKLDI